MDILINDFRTFRTVQVRTPQPGYSRDSRPDCEENVIVLFCIDVEQAYQYTIKLDEEIRYLWGRRISVGSVLIALCRYLPFINILAIIGLSIGIHALIRSFLKVVLFTRAYAVWGRSKRILFLLGVVLVGCGTGSAYNLAKLEPPRSSNIFRPNSPQMALVLLLIKSVQHARDMRNMDLGGHKRSIIDVMARDGEYVTGELALYYSSVYRRCIESINIVNVVFLGRIQPNLRVFLFTLQGALQNIMCSRLLFHIRNVNESPNGSLASHSTNVQTLSSFQVRQETEDYLDSEFLCLLLTSNYWLT
ncbi:hypothetical protein SCHPADRAFT_893561 [Schizopora paradoxa]|uniref:DUF6533 domain-containing protein n=1 Tax=Schizopora paradoxa TaxID=27342 RepID=A0A0H2RH45_9AGAM|nr:hypothetical protein SCHPADRAFT_893561 [Schizopora paradoxa]